MGPSIAGSIRFSTPYSTEVEIAVRHSSSRGEPTYRGGWIDLDFGRNKSLCARGASANSPLFIPPPSTRCTIYTAVYKDQPVVVKLMRKDVQDATLVRDELELELALLQR